MKNKTLISAMIVAVWAFQACKNPNKNSNDPESISATTMETAKKKAENISNQHIDTSSFMVKAAIGGMMEVELGNMAQQIGKDPKVKEFGALMVKDHSKANDELKRIADAKKVMLPTVFPNKIQRHINDMKELNGKAFDKHYMSMMVEDHVKDIALFKAATTNSDTSISNFAKKTLPVLETHHQKATSINASLK
jgi:putative membrane protein